MSQRNATVGRSALSIESFGGSKKGAVEHHRDQSANSRRYSRDDGTGGSEDEGSRRSIDPKVSHILLGLEIERLSHLEHKMVTDICQMEDVLHKRDEKIYYMEEFIQRIKKELEDEKRAHKATQETLKDTKRKLDDYIRGAIQRTPSSARESSIEHSRQMHEMQSKINTLEESVKVLMTEKLERERMTVIASHSEFPPNSSRRKDVTVFVTADRHDKVADDADSYEYIPGTKTSHQEKLSRRVEEKSSQLKMNPQLKRMVPQSIDIRRPSRSNTLFSEPNISEIPRKRDSKLFSEPETGLDTLRNTLGKDNAIEATSSHDNESEINQAINFDHLRSGNIFSKQPMYNHGVIDSRHGKTSTSKSKGLVLGKNDCIATEISRLTNKCSSSRQIGSRVKQFSTITQDKSTGRRPSATVFSTLGNINELSDFKIGKYNTHLNVQDSKSNLRLDEFFSSSNDIRFKSLSKLDKGMTEVSKGNNSQSGFSKFVYKGTKDPRKRLGMASEKKYTHASCHLDLLNK